MKLYGFFLFFLFSGFISVVSGQKPVLDPLKFTDRMINVRQMYCGNPAEYELYLNGDLKLVNTDYTVFFFSGPDPGTRGGVYHMQTQFGFLKPGDEVKVREVCTGLWSDPVTVRDDFAYIEMPASGGHGGNGIGPDDSAPPYDRLSTPLSVGKCSPTQVNGHVLFPVTIKIPGVFDLPNTGIFKINGSPVSAYGFEKNFGGLPTNYSINSDGSITFDNFLGLTTSTHFSGASPVSIEYRHNGANPTNDFSIGIGGVEIRFIKNNSFEIWKRNYLGDYDIQGFSGNFTNATYKITFDQNVYRVYVDDVERTSLSRFVIYSSDGDGISNTGLLPYRTGIIYQPFSSGTRMIMALFDGAVTTYQKINVAEDIIINEAVSNVACNGDNTGSITLNPTGGLPPLQYSRDGVSYQNGNTFGGLAAGNHSMYVRDASGCISTKTVYVGENAPLTLSVGVVTNAICSGDHNGSIQLNASGGAGFLQYGIDGNNYQASNTLSGLSAGTYQLYVKDAAGCTRSVTQTVGLQSLLQVETGIQKNVSCSSGNDGSVTLSVAGSSPSGTIQYSKDGVNFQGSPVFPGLTAGDYTFIVKDDICQTSLSVTITEPSVLEAGATVIQNVLCFGGNEGQIEVNAIGGTAGYEYSLDGITYVITNVFAHLTAGNYKFWVRDANGCIAQTTIFSISQPVALQAGIQSKTAVKCFGGNDAMAIIEASGGVAAYTYSLDGGNFQNSNVFTGLTAGSKTFTVKDNNGCLKSVTTDILQPPAPFVISISQQDNLICNNDNSGQVILSGQGGTPAYQYSLDNVTFQSSGTFTGLGAGSYMFYGKDANGCRFSTSLSVSQPEPVHISHLKKLDVDCEYYEKGELAFVATGSNGGFSYHLSGTDLHHLPIAGLQNNDGVFTGLSVGNYTMTAVDSKGCRKDYAASVVPKNSGIRFEISSQLPASCTTTDGEITVINVTGGRPQPDYHFRISSAAGFSTSGAFNNLAGGNYIITVADELCSYNQEVDLRLPESLKAGYKISPVDCQTPKADVYIEPISGGSGTYELAMNGPFSANRMFGRLDPGTYAVLIRDNPFTCHTILSFEVKEQNRADLKTDFVQQISCYGGSDGIIRVRGDNNAGPFTYSFNDLDNFSENREFTGLTTGTYKIYAQNAIGCRDTIKVSLQQPAKIEWNVLTRNNDCFGDKTGEITITGTGGTPPYNYAIDDAFMDSGHFGSLPAGYYMTRIKDSKSCEFSQYTQLVQPSEIKLTPIYQDTIRCFGEHNGVVRIDAEGGTPGYIYAISDSTQFGGTPLFSDLMAGTYRFFVKDSKQCPAQTQLTLKEPDKLELSLSDKTDPLCYGEKNGRIHVEAKGGNGDYVYSMDNTVSQKEGVFENLTQADYTFKVTDRKACEDTISRVRLVWPKALTATMNITPPVCYGDSNGVLKAAIGGGTAPFVYSLSLPSELIPETISLPGSEVEVTGLPPGSRNLWLQDSNGCRLQLNVNIPVPDKLNPIVFEGLPEEVCKGQEVTLSAGNIGQAVRWFRNDTLLQTTGGAQEITVDQSGKYIVKVNNNTGCEITGEYNLIYNDKALKADFLIPTQAFAGDTVVCLDITKPVPDRVVWTLPTEAFKIEENEIRIGSIFTTEGQYTVKMDAYSGDCHQIVSHSIIISEKGSSEGQIYSPEELIKSVTIFPNPSNGQFMVKVELASEKELELSLIRNISGEKVYAKKEPKSRQFSIDINLNVVSGVYILQVKVDKVLKSYRVAVNK